jgi:arylsulfatase A-like enzyme
MLGDHHMGAKGLFLEPSAHVPYILRPAADLNTLRGTTCDSIVCMADILPTFCHLAGAEVPERCDGIDLLAQAKGEARRDRLFHLCSPTTGILDGQLKYTWAWAGGDELMFDLAADPHEQHDLIRAGSHKAEHERLRHALAEEMERHGHDFAKGGDLVATQPKPDRAKVRSNSWPGFHSADHESHDVLH